MAIKETPTNFRVYHTSMINAVTQKRDKLIEEKDLLESLLISNKEQITDNKSLYLELFDLNLDDYIEFVDNIYIDGSFYKVAKGLYLNKKDDYKLRVDLFNLFNVANQQKKIYELNKEIAFCNKLLKINKKQYTEILRVFMTEVHKRLILEGEGYAFGHNIGWICINRCLIKKGRKQIDYAATKKREAELKAAGKRIYNKEEAEWCQRNGIEYNAEDKRVFMTNEYCYEIPLIESKMPHSDKLKLEIADYRHASLRGKTNDQIIKESNNDTNVICELGLDLKTKLTLCDKVDKLLYTKFIRNENQKPINTRPSGR